jgi:di/tricarboxylate transporter
VNTDQLLIVAILIATVAMFLWGRWRHDMVALAALLACVAAGLVPSAAAFAGFGHPAVITVACVLVLSHGLQRTGAVDALTRVVLPRSAGPTLSIAALAGLAAGLSSVMNNVGALALLMPVGIQIARRLELPPGRVLMPLAFGSILGGMTTLIGTPPNLIVSAFRAEAGGASFAMFDFTPVGLAVAVVGVAFVALVGWRLVPARKPDSLEGFETGAYLTEARVGPDSKAVGQTLMEIETALDETGAQVVGLVRNEVRVVAPQPGRVVRDGDILVVEAEAEAIPDVLSRLGLSLEEAKHEEAADVAARPGEGDQRTGHSTGEAKGEKKRRADDVVLAECAVMPQSALVGRSASDVLLRTRFGVNLLAVSRQGRRSTARLRSMPLSGGDVLLMQGPEAALAEFASTMDCLPLAERELRVPVRRQAVTAGVIMALAVGGAALGLVPASVAFAAGVLASMAFRTVPLRAVYQAIDWPVIVLLGALIPVAGAMASTGTADLVARFLLEQIAQGNVTFALVTILVVTMTLSDLMNNAATAAVMCPVAIGAAQQLGVSADPFLMAVAVGASCAFLTPIGHQNNTLILGPGGFRFGDYWRLGVPIEILVVAVSVPMLLWVWPL